MCFHQSDGIVKIEAVNVFCRQQCSQQIVLGAVEAGVDAPPIFPRLRHRNLWPKTLRYLQLFQSPLFLNSFALPRCQNMLMVTLVVPAPPSPPGLPSVRCQATWQAVVISQDRASTTVRLSRVRKDLANQRRSSFLGFLGFLPPLPDCLRATDCCCCEIGIGILKKIILVLAMVLVLMI